MKRNRFLVPVAAGLLAATVGTGARAQVPASVTLSDVYSLIVPTTSNEQQTINGYNGLRSIAVNNNPGSPWAGTIYITRMAYKKDTTPTDAPADIFFWKGSQTLQAGGPNLDTPSGRFDMAGAVAAGFDTSAGLYMWSIGVADDDYVYAAGLNNTKAGQIVRFNADGTNPVIVATNVPRARQFYVTGGGANTRFTVVEDKSNPTPVDVWSVSATDANGAPTAFTKATPFSVTDGGTSFHQDAVNNAGTSLYFTKGGNDMLPRKYDFATKAADATFTASVTALGNALVNACGAAIDSQDRVVFVAMSNWEQDYGIAALNPATGEALTTNTSYRLGFKTFTPPAAPEVKAGTASISFWDLAELGRYSDRHYFYLYSRRDYGNVLGVVSTDLPAPAPSNVTVTNPGTGTTLKISWAMPDDPEVKAVNVYRSTSAGTLGTLVAGSPVSGTTVTDTGLTAGTTYYYTVQSAATDPFNGTQYTSTNTDQVSGQPGIIEVPAAPDAQKVTDTKNGGELKVEWTTPSAYANAIRIYRSETSGSLGAKVKEITSVTAGAAASWTDTGLTNGTAYYYTIKAVNGRDEESTNTAQVSGTPTDAVAPTFAGVTSAKDLGFGGLRLTWGSAVDNSDVVYGIYTGKAADAIDFTAPAATTTNTSFDLKGYATGAPLYVAVRAKDASGNEETNTAALGTTLTRVIVDSDQNANVNFDRFNPQPDASVPALQPVIIGVFKGTDGGPTDLVDSGFLPGVFFQSTNDKLGKASYTLPITTAGYYDLGAFWTSEGKVNVPGFVYHIQYPGGGSEDVALDQVANKAKTWHSLGVRYLVPGNLVVVGDATKSTDTSVDNWNVSGAVRALYLGPTLVTIYRAAQVINPDGDLSTAEWGDAPTVMLDTAAQDVVGGNWTGPNDYSAAVKLKYDDTNLYFAANVKDDVLEFSPVDDGAIFFRDSLEIYLGMDPTADPMRDAYGPKDTQMVFSATDDGFGMTAKWLSFPADTRVDMIGSTWNVAVVKTTGGYVMEGAIPWTSIAGGSTAPAAGTMVRFNLGGNDNDVLADGQQSALMLGEKGGSWGHVTAWTNAVFAGAPPAFLAGDVDMNGTVDGRDAALAARIAGGLTAGTSPAVSQKAADMDNNGSVTGADVLRILAKANGR